jgi:homoserine/homoserine lactone efflux protein
MKLETWLLFALTEAALCISPGPAVIYVTSHGLSRGFGRSVAAALGIVTGNVFYFVASALGLGALILASGQVFLIIKWVGAAYLVWLGLRMVLGHSSLAKSAHDPTAGGVRPETRRAYGGGIVVQLSNPKNLVFFLAILPPFIDPAGNVLRQIAILGVTSQIIEIVVLLSYGGIGSKAGEWIRESRFAVWVDRVAGSMLASIGAGLAIARRAAS